jgi:hypothetical protein
VAKFGLDLESGRELAAKELYGDSYRDPWGWPEILSKGFVAKLDPEADLGIDKANVASSLKPYFYPMDVPKSYLGVRPAVVQDPLSRLVYNAAVLNGASDLHSGLQPWVYGWRLRGDEVAKNGPEWGPRSPKVGWEPSRPAPSIAADRLSQPARAPGAKMEDRTG